MGKILNLVEEKKRICLELEKILDKESIDKAKKDHHSRRLPRPCGMTIHTGIGCSYTCSYCYIYDMGFPAKVEPYPLKPLEIVYALAKNPYIVPRKTLAAYGSVTEPFLPETRELSISYIKNVYKWLSLPSQISTKSIIDEALAQKLKEAEPSLSILITVVTINKSNSLESLAPSPLNRLKSVSVASRASLSVYLFIRPIIPGITDREADEILKLGVEYGAKGVVVGSLRVTQSIIQRLKSKNIEINDIMKRLPRLPKNKEQISIKINDIIKIIEKKAYDYNIKFFRSACMANIDSHNDYCYMCSLGPCGDLKKKHSVEHNDIAEYIEFLNLKYKSIIIRDDCIIIILRENTTRRLINLASVLSYVARMKTKIFFIH